MNQELLLGRCVVCKKTTNTRCSRCHNIYYCNTEHQRQDWKRHKGDCKKLPKKDKSVADAVLDSTVNNIDSSSEKHLSNYKEKVVALNASKDTKNCIPINISVESPFLDSSRNDTEQNTSNIITTFSEKSVISKVVHTDNNSSGAGAITYEGSSENEILSASTQQIGTDLSSAEQPNVLKVVNRTVDTNMLAMPGYTIEAPPKAIHSHKDYPEGTLRGNGVFTQNKSSYVMGNIDPYIELCDRVIRDMSTYGVCVLDNFLGKERGMLVLNEVLDMYHLGKFKPGQLVSNHAITPAKTIRSDRITWIDGKEPQCKYIGNLIQQVDNIILRANKMTENGKMGDYTINGRTKAMVACYPGSGSHYVKHVDNPNKDGRCITAIYYLNRDWDVNKSGGLLRVFPEGHHQVADIAPVFDRMLFFWSDRRNPHEVQPAFDTRYAITLWYFDAHEREEATKRYQEKRKSPASTSK